MNIIITSPSLNVNENVSGISSVTQFIISSNTENVYTHFKIGRKDNEKRNLIWFLRLLRLYARWTSLMITQKEALIHFNLALSKDSIIRDSPLIFVARLFHKRMIIHIHGGNFLMHKENPLWMNSILKVVLSGKNPIIVLSPLEEEELRQRLRLDKLFVLPNCPDLKDAMEFNRTYEQDEILKLLFLGRITENKGIEFIYTALESLRQKGLKFKFIMAGKGPQEKLYVEKFCNLLGADFEFTGVVSGDKKTDILKNCNVFLLPSFFEGLPMALIESMSFGLVPVTTEVGSIRYVINNGINGLLVKKYSSEEIVLALEQLSENKMLKQELSRNARQYIFSNYCPEDYVLHLNKIYKY